MATNSLTRKSIAIILELTSIRTTRENTQRDPVYIRVYQKSYKIDSAQLQLPLIVISMSGTRVWICHQSIVTIRSVTNYTSFIPCGGGVEWRTGRAVRCGNMSKERSSSLQVGIHAFQALPD